ncbi:MAG: hypothetical protein AVDCRST_MAG77-3000 [uncultured Chloroflexi bacterium]|uniref:ORC1/DEAH AAA+ ATPase domain-containing protein n=1 Tax=uncultured Chloroflexota bacterium TaxID=166587 RepID=A0A6J4ICD2_9CHLR|nr:MAG: hypothetical protein AVDCRST_MAG77-3000 [uncultured Chloroflexota bacterium]
MLLQDARLVTVTGPGGVGKTRLCLAVLRDVAAVFQDGTVFVDLAPFTALDSLPHALTAALSIVVRSDQTAHDALHVALRGRTLLLFLDSFEPLLAGAAQEVATLLAACPGVTVLVTSRATLRLRWEHVFTLAPLEAPPPPEQPAADLSRVLRYPAVALFLDRARAAGARFLLDAHTAAAVAAICTRLDGLPLALELAASRAAAPAGRVAGAAARAAAAAGERAGRPAAAPAVALRDDGLELQPVEARRAASVPPVRRIQRWLDARRSGCRGRRR